jgi:hypothetical protein
MKNKIEDITENVELTDKERDALLEELEKDFPANLSEEDVNTLVAEQINHSKLDCEKSNRYERKQPSPNLTKGKILREDKEHPIRDYPDFCPGTGEECDRCGGC